MNRLLATVGVFLAAGCSGGGHGGYVDLRPSVEAPFSHDVTLGTQTALRLEGINGTIEVTGTPDAKSIVVTGVRRVQADTLEDAEAHMLQLEVVVESSPTQITVRTVQPKLAEGRNYTVNYTITLPEDLAVDIVTVNGDTTVRTLAGDCTIRALNGSVLADAIEGNVTATLANGDITASVTLPSGGEIDLGVVNGNILLRIPQTTSAEFSSKVATGSIMLTNLSLSNEKVTPWTCSGTLGGGDGTISLDVGNGAIAVQGS